MQLTGWMGALLVLFGAQAWAVDESSGESDEPTENASSRLEDTHPVALERIIVQALPIERSAIQSAQPIDVLAGEALEDRRGVTLGETLANQVGVQSSYYGPGAGRPIIRGLGGGRVRVLNDALSLGDASSSSDDHAVSADPLLIDQIEILRGPATLLYGSGAIGGVINLIDNRIPSTLPMGSPEASYEIRGNSVSDEISGVVRLDGHQGSLAWHVDGSWRSSDDYKIPLSHEAEEEEHEGDHDHEAHEPSDRLFNSFVESQSGTLGLSYIGERGFVGASIRHYASDYGIPAPHFHEEDADEEHMHEDGHDDEHAEEEIYATVDLEQTRFDLKAGLDMPWSGIKRLSVRLAYDDYAHEEKEFGEAHDLHGEHADEDHDHDAYGTRFDIETVQARVELETESFEALGQTWVGALGLQYDDEDFSSLGAEAYVVPNQTESIALFSLQETTWGAATLSFGARVEQTKIKADMDYGHDDHDHADDMALEKDRRKFTVGSMSAGVVWPINEGWQATANVSYAQRAPSAGELFANGAHLATFSFERGNANLVRESARNLDIGLHRHSDRFDLRANAFYKDVDDFILWQPVDETLGGFPVRLATQADAKLYGTEVMATWQFHNTPAGDFDLEARHDWVRGKLDEGTSLPRISPQRFSLSTDWHQGPWRASVSWQHLFDQDQTALYETPTQGYDLINARLAYTIDFSSTTMTAFIEGKNLTNQLARVHTSYLKDYAPLPGRALIVGLRGAF